ncbi:hypothetical protein ACOSP6_15615 [Tenacibaculum sp. MEBiC06402]|uniref:hypothetical protein n=1 Tax=unclassified Tenacibaculum TaxID=2635139 RepID=UPI003B9CA6D2
MGENKHIEELDAFAKKYIKDVEQESPSLDFTSSVMDIIGQTDKSLVFKPTPLISKKVWVLLFSILTICIFYVSKGKSILATWKMPERFKYNPKFEFPDLFQNISVSNTMLTACFFFTLLIFIQIYLFKTRFDKRLNS